MAKLTLFKEVKSQLKQRTSNWGIIQFRTCFLDVYLATPYGSVYKDAFFYPYHFLSLDGAPSSCQLQTYDLIQI